MLAARAVETKRNEIVAIPELLDMLALEGAIVTIAAMGTQKAIAAKIVAKKADYVLALKENQGALHADVEAFFADPARRSGNRRRQRHPAPMTRQAFRAISSSSLVGMT